MEIRPVFMADLGAAVTDVKVECFPAAEAATEALFRARLCVLRVVLVAVRSGEAGGLCQWGNLQVRPWGTGIKCG